MQSRETAWKAGGEDVELKALMATPNQLRRRFNLMDRMMQKREVDLCAALDVDGGLAFIEARAKCRYCLHEEECRRWLTIRTPRRAPDFCPNAKFFSACMRRDN